MIDGGEGYDAASFLLMVQGEVFADLREPRLDVPYLRPLFAPLPSLQHRVLHDVLSISGVECDAERETIEAVAMGKDGGAEIHEGGELIMDNG
jgi:hypothetical protein